MIRQIAVILLIIVAFTSIAACLSSNPENVVQRDNEPSVILVEAEDPEMLAAIQEAKDTFDEFETYLASGRSDLVYFSVKASFPITDDPSTKEHIWLYDVKITDDEIVGKIGNEPLDATYLSLDEEVTTGKENISDWMVVDENRQLYGGYTIRVLRDRVPEEERRQFDAAIGLIFESE